MSDAESLKGVDVEKHAASEPGVAPVEPAALTGPWAKLLKRMGDGGVEIEGMDRIPEDQRSTENGWGQLLFWFSVRLQPARTGGVGAACCSGHPQEQDELTRPHAGIPCRSTKRSVR